ncbi:hypothetical protein E2C01_072721 [Portunus trituberculatus]|uniref:Uncharacterized protein n=1 Tax=Portunus trituberculatus TaxID=210409 RepID=A0A5B7I9P3_PORTR|nr:hypothetical protein [Portunus trituberculatus]
MVKKKLRQEKKLKTTVFLDSSRGLDPDEHIILPQTSPLTRLTPLSPLLASQVPGAPYSEPAGAPSQPAPLPLLGRNSENREQSWYSGTMRALESEGSPSARVRILSTVRV